MASDTVAGRLQELGSLWHSWRAAILEDLGDLPPQFEEILLRELRSELEKHRKTLQDALTSCTTTLATLAAPHHDIAVDVIKPVARSCDKQSTAPSA